MPSACSRRNRRNRRNSRRRGGASEPGAYPFGNGMGSPSAQSLMQGSSYASMHANQHGGVYDLFEDASGNAMKGGMAPVDAPTVELQGDLRNTARIGPLDAKYAEIAGMQDGGRRRRRRKTRKGRKGSRKSRKGRKASRKGRKHRKASRKSRKSRSQRRRRGGALTGAPLNSDADVSSFYGDASGPKMLLKDYSAAGLNPDWKDVGSYVPRA